MSSETQSFKGVGTPTTRMYGLMAVIALGWVFLGGLFFTPEDAVQGDAVRIMSTYLPLGLRIWRSSSRALHRRVG